MAKEKHSTEQEIIRRYRDVSLPVEERVEALVSAMTLPEKVSQLVNDAAAIPRLGIPDYNWCNECLHGVAHAGLATVFPQAIGLAASWDVELLHRVAAAIADEARAKHQAFVARGDRSIHTGLNFWSPNINIFRDPRWGRGQETYGEDPYLTSRLGVAYVRGFQGDDPQHLRAGATVKHFAAHSGPEAGRHGFDARVSPKDLHETYLPAFRACVEEAKVHAVMSAYNRLNGEACSASETLLQKILRDEWGFEGYVVSDCGAIDDIYQGHKLAANRSAAAALAVAAGCDLNCGSTYVYLVDAVEKGLLSQKDLDRALRRVLAARFRLGTFDPPETGPYGRTPIEVVDSPAHRQLALQAARESIVLLKNASGVLPLKKDLRRVLIVGPNAASIDILLGNYNGLNGRMVTVMEGIVGKLGPATAAKCKLGCTLVGDNERGFFHASIGAEEADVIVAVLGLSQTVEGEEGVAFQSSTGGDRDGLALPGKQLELLKKLRSYGRPLVLVVGGGSPVDLSWAQEHVDAIVAMWYPGEEGGNAVADVLFGDHNPAGRLPVTFVRSAAQLPPFEDYSMAGRTYRYLSGEPLYPFGYGLSYTTFSYSDLRLGAARLAAGEELTARIMVTNTGGRAGDEIVQLYVSASAVAADAPRWSLKGFKRIHLRPGEAREVSLTVPARELALVDAAGKSSIRPGRYTVYVGGQQPDERSAALTGARPCAEDFQIAGPELPVA